MSIFDVGLTVAGIIIALEEMRPKHFNRRNVTLAGYSLGAHAAGYAGAVLDGQVEQIIGLDPAGPLFTLPAAVSPKYRLDQTDAQFVQVLHTSGGTLGTSLKCGHADFYPNGGRAPQRNCLMFMNLRDMQNTSESPQAAVPPLFLSVPPCYLINHSLSLCLFPTDPIACSHSAAAIFFRQSMDPQYPFVGTECASYRDFSAGRCDNNRRARFGIHSQRRTRGTFYFDTSSTHPYVQRQRRGQRLFRASRRAAPILFRSWSSERERDKQSTERAAAAEATTTVADTIGTGEFVRRRLWIRSWRGRARRRCQLK